MSSAKPTGNATHSVITCAATSAEAELAAGRPEANAAAFMPAEWVVGEVIAVIDVAMSVLPWLPAAPCIASSPAATTATIQPDQRLRVLIPTRPHQGAYPGT